MLNKAIHIRQAAARLLHGTVELSHLETLDDERLCDEFSKVFFSGKLRSDAREEDITLLLEFSCETYLEPEYIPPATSPLICAGEVIPTALGPPSEVPEEFKWIASQSKRTT